MCHKTIIGIFKNPKYYFKLPFTDDCFLDKLKTGNRLSVIKNRGGYSDFQKNLLLIYNSTQKIDCKIFQYNLLIFYSANFYNNCHIK